VARPDVGGDSAVKRHGRSKAGAVWTDELVVYALDRFHRRNLRTPTLAELKTGVDEMPSYATIRRRYGSAGHMLGVHGYLVRSTGGQLGRLFLPDRDSQGRFLAKKAT
jgi:hypothetical protein